MFNLNKLKTFITVTGPAYLPFKFAGDSRFSGLIPLKKVLGNGKYTNDSASGTINLNVAEANHFKLTLVGNVTLNITNMQDTDVIIVKLLQDSTGSRTVTWSNSELKWPGGVAITQTATADKSDVYTFIKEGTDIHVSVIQNY